LLLAGHHHRRQLPPVGARCCQRYDGSAARVGLCCC
jgi:hypothetical protein